MGFSPIREREEVGFNKLLISCADMVDDVTLSKKRCHVVTFETITCHTRVHVHACECACVHVCAHVYVIKEKAPC